MCKSCRQLACDERCQIKALSDSVRKIADQLGRSPATISHEAARNRGRCGYRHNQAQTRTSARRHEASSSLRQLAGELWGRIEGHLRHLGEETVDRMSKYTTLERLASRAAVPMTEALLLRMGRQYFPKGDDLC